MILREMQSSPVNTLLSLLTVAVAAGVLVAMVCLSRASVDATRKMMKDMGFNLLITPPGVEPARYQALDFSGGDMPESYIDKLAGSTVLAQHLVGKYQKTIDVQGMTAVLTGVLPEVTKHGTVKAPMPTAYEVEQGTVKVGSALAEAMKLSPGDSVTILGRAFMVDTVLPEKGLIPDDIRIYAHLHDVQALLDRPGRVNAIDALACFCPVNVDDLFAALEETVKEALPEVNVKPYRSIIKARQAQRTMMYRLELAVLAIVMAASAAAIWGLTWQNVYSRRHEIGVFRALGVSGARIAMLFTGKILIYSETGAALGCAAGVAAAHLMNMTGRPIVAPWFLFAGILLLTPLTAVLFGLPPIIGRLLQEPIHVLGEGTG
jgi:ABC-type lipoprotein release transport system permease subunit